MDTPGRPHDTDDTTHRGGKLFALRLHEAGHDPGTWFGELEHVLSGRRHGFRGSLQLIERLAQELALAGPMHTTPPPMAALPTQPPEPP